MRFSISEVAVGTRFCSGCGLKISEAVEGEFLDKDLGLCYTRPFMYGAHCPNCGENIGPFDPVFQIVTREAVYKCGHFIKDEKCYFYDLPDKIVPQRMNRTEECEMCKAKALADEAFSHYVELKDQFMDLVNSGKFSPAPEVKEGTDWIPESHS
jgi:hypothetical protein